MDRFPVNGEEARKTGTFYKITSDQALRVVTGKKTPGLLKFFISNDVINVGEVILPSGGIGPRQTEYDVHDGDAVFYVKMDRSHSFSKKQKKYSM